MIQAVATTSLGAGQSTGRPPRRLLFVVNNAAFFASHRLAIGRAAKLAGYDVHVACPESPSLRALTAEGFTVHDIPLDRRRVNPLTELRAFRAVVMLYRCVRPDIVHHVTMKPVLYGSLAARLASVPAVVNAVSGLGYLFIARGTAAALCRSLVMVLARAAFRSHQLCVIFQNDEDRSLFETSGLVRPDQAVTIRGSGVDLDRFFPAPEPDGPPIVVLAARMLWDKGVGEFVEAAGLVRARLPQARLVLVGDSDPGNPSAVPEEQLRAWAAAGVIEWWGHRDDMPDVLAGAHVVCLPSYREGLSKVLLEAAASGRAIVTTDVPGCRDVIGGDRENGLLVPPADAPALALAILALLEDPIRRRAMGKAGRIRAEETYGVDRVARAHLDVYAELMEMSVTGA